MFFGGSFVGHCDWRAFGGEPQDTLYDHGGHFLVCAGAGGAHGYLYGHWQSTARAFVPFQKSASQVSPLVR